MNIAIGSDHAGFPLKATVVNALKAMGHTVIDCGSYTPDPVDFPDIARLVGGKILGGEAEKGVMVCGTGVGAAIAANKIPGIRASVCHDVYSAHQCVEHDDVNVCCLGAQIIGSELVVDLLRTYLSAQFSTEEDFRRRVAKLTEMENEYKHI